MLSGLALTAIAAIGLKPKRLNDTQYSLNRDEDHFYLAIAVHWTFIFEPHFYRRRLSLINFRVICLMSRRMWKLYSVLCVLCGV